MTILIILGMLAAPSGAAAPRVSGLTAESVRGGKLNAGVTVAAGGSLSIPNAVLPFEIAVAPNFTPAAKTLAPFAAASVPSPAPAQLTAVPSAGQAFGAGAWTVAAPEMRPDLIASAFPSKDSLSASARSADAGLSAASRDTAYADESFDGRRRYGAADAPQAPAQPKRFLRATVGLAAAQTVATAVTVGDIGRIDPFLFRIDDARQAWEGLSISGIGQSIVQSVTSGFIHINMNHFAVNIVGFLVLAPMLERMAGSLTLLAVFLGGMLAGHAVLILSQAHGFSLGASSGVAALMGVLAAHSTLLILRGVEANASWRETLRAGAIVIIGLLSLIAGMVEVRQFLSVGPVANGVAVGAHAGGWAFGFAAWAAVSAARLMRR